MSDRLTAALADRYRIERELGAGGMATVYLAHDVRHDRKVALKVLRPELAAVIGAERFLTEIRTTAALQHPHILPLFDSGAADGFLFYVMPYVKGETIRDRLEREKQLPIADAVRIAGEVAAALDYAHRHGVIHRDIKPENILLHDGSALVADFGIALAASKAGGSRMTETGMSLGTPHYMSPEQALGEREITARSDVYALGCVLYEMLLGEPPFTGPTAQAIVAKVMNEKPAGLVARRGRIPVEVEDAVLTALEKLPADRFGSAAEFAAALTGTGPVPFRAGSRAGASASRRGLWPALAVLGLVAGVIGGWLARRPPAVPEVPQVRVLLTPDSLSPPVVHNCCGPAVAIAPDGRRFAYTVRQAGSFAVMSRDRAEGFTPVTIGMRGEHQAFSPDGESVVFAQAIASRTAVRRELVRVPAQGGTPSVLGPIASSALTGLTWLADGSIVFGDQEGWPGLLRLTPGHAAERLTTPDTAAGERRHVAPHYVPEVNGVLFTVWPASENPADATVKLLTLDDHRLRVVGRGLGPQYTRSGYLVTAAPDGTVNAEPVDLRTGRSRGPAFRVAEGVSIRGLWTADFAVSGDGTLVFDQGHAEGTVEVVGQDGSRRVVPVPLQGAAHWDSPTVSPDARLVAAAGSIGGVHHGYVIDLELGTALRLTFEGQTEFFSWSSDGRTLVYPKADSMLAEQAADRSGQERILWTGDGGVLGRISAHGPWIAFARSVQLANRPTGDPGTDILVFRRDSGTVRPYLATRFIEKAPAIAPDGRWLAYVSNETGRDEVYLSAFPDASAGRHVVSTDGGGEPQWSSDGRWLYYRTGDGQLIAREVRPGAGGTLGPARVILQGSWDRAEEGADYDVMPSGKGFVMVGQRAVGSRLVWILNAVPGPPRR